MKIDFETGMQIFIAALVLVSLGGVLFAEWLKKRKVE